MSSALTVLYIECPVHWMYCALNVPYIECPVHWMPCTLNPMYIAYHVHWMSCTLNVRYIEGPVHWMFCTLNVLYIECPVHWMSCALNVLYIECSVHWMFCTLNVLFIERPLHWMLCTLLLLLSLLLLLLQKDVCHNLWRAQTALIHYTRGPAEWLTLKPDTGMLTHLPLGDSGVVSWTLQVCWWTGIEVVCTWHLGRSSVVRVLARLRVALMGGIGWLKPSWR